MAASLIKRLESATEGSRELSERFFQKVSPEPNSGCWLWTGAVNSNGYGSFWIGGRTYKAHRVSYILAGNALDQESDIDHLCRVRTCVNPLHLESVSRKTNVHRGNGPAGINARKAFCFRGHALDEENTRIRKNGGRECRACQRHRYHEKKAILRAHVKETG